MEKRQIWRLISLFDEAEKVRFDAWLVAELNGKETLTLALYRELCSFRDIDTLWIALFPNVPVPDKPFYDSSYRRLEHQLAYRIELYLSFQSVRQDTYLTNLHLVNELNHRNATDLFSAKMRKLNRKLEASPIRDESYFRQRYKMDREMLHFTLKHNPRKTADMYEQVNRSYEDRWIHEKLFQAVVNLNTAQTIGKNVNSFLVEEILELVEQEERLNSSSVLVLFHQLYLLLTNRTGADQVFEMFREEREKLEKYTAQNVFTILHNHYAKGVLKGEETTLRQMFLLYEWGHEHELLLIDGILPIGYYRNMVTVGLRLNEDEKVWYYLNEMKPLLPEDQREEVFEFNQARYFVKLKEYVKAKKVLSRKFKNINFEIAGRLTLLKVRYEMGEREELDQELQTLLIFTRRQENIPQLTKTGLGNEIKLFQKLVLAFYPKDIVKLQKKIHEVHPLSNKDWLLEMIEAQLKKNTGSDSGTR